MKVLDEKKRAAVSDGHGHIVALNLENNMTVNQKSKKIRGTAKVKMKGKDGKKQQGTNQTARVRREQEVKDTKVRWRSLT